MTKAAVCLGSTGAVGQLLLRQLVDNPEFSTVVTLVRKPGADQTSGKVREHVVKDMEQLESEVQSAMKDLKGEVVGFSTLGIGANTIKLTIDEHRAVDVQLNSSFAKGLKASGKVQHLVFMSAVGANPQSWAGGPGSAGMPRYNRVKGEAEEAVKGSGIENISIFRPGAILGIPNTGSFGSAVLPWFDMFIPSYGKSITGENLAKSMAIRGAQTISPSEPKDP